MYSSPKDLHAKQFMEFDGHKDEVNCVSFSSNFSFMVTGSDDHRVRVFDVKTKQCSMNLRKHKGAVKSVAISPCDRYFASGSFDKTAKIWRADEGSCLHDLEGHTKSVEVVAFSSCSVYLCTGSWDRTAILWCVQTGCRIKTFTGHGSLVQSVSFSLKHELLASGSWDFNIRVWNLNHVLNRKIVDTFIKNKKANLHTKVHEDNIVKEDMIEDINESEDVLTHAKDDGSIIGIDHWQRSMENKSNNSEESDIHIGRGIYVSYRKACMTMEHLGNVDELDGITVDQENFTSKTWRVKDNDATRNTRIDEINCKEIHENHEQKSTNQANAEGINKNELMRHHSDGANADTENCKVLTGHRGNIHATAFSKFGMLASGSWDKSVRIWNPLNGDCIHILLGHTGWVQAVCFAPDATYCASAADDESVKVWDLVTGECVNTLEGCTYLTHHCTFTPNGHIIAAGASLPPADKQQETESERAQLAERQNTDPSQSVIIAL
ncbi:hypothetical protein BsWGS_29205 [Bradybaena similaris]